MKRKMKFITKIIMVLLMVVGCLSYRSVFADDDKLKITVDTSVTEAIAKEGNGGLVVDLYKVADIIWDGNPSKATYVLKTDADSPFKEFNDLDVGVKETGGISDDEVKKLANKAAGIVFGSDPKIDPVGEPLPVNEEHAVNTGLYLAIVRSTKMNKKDITAADTDEYLVSEDGAYYSFANSHDKEYDFDPYLVFVRGDNTNPVNLDEKGEDGELVMLKYTEKDRFGLMEIVKHVTLGGQPATVVFRVVGYESEDAFKAGEDPIYEKVLSIGINEAGEYHDDTLLLDDILVNTYVVVTEEYAGASYVLYKTVTPDSSIITPVEEDDEGNPIPQTWEFYNKLDDKRKKGYGIRNTVSDTGIEPTILDGGTSEDEE